jgi:hypothetical protein
VSIAVVHSLTRTHCLCFLSFCFSFLLLYLGLMHLFMFCIIYYTAHHSHSGCDPSIDHLSPHDTAAIAAKLSSAHPM